MFRVESSLLALLLPMMAMSAPGLPASIDEQYLAQCGQYQPSEKRYARNPNGLTRAEMAAIYAYTYANSRELNGPLGRGEELEECPRLQLQLIDRALAKLPVYAGTVYRGTWAKYVPGREGETVALKSYTSTSPDSEVARTFIEDAFVTLKIKSGRRLGVYSSEIGEGMSPNEEEVLLPHGTMIHVSRRHREVVEVPEDRVPEGKKEVWVIEAEQISPGSE